MKPSQDTIPSQDTPPSQDMQPGQGMKPGQLFFLLAVLTLAAIDGFLALWMLGLLLLYTLDFFFVSVPGVASEGSDWGDTVAVLRAGLLPLLCGVGGILLLWKRWRWLALIVAALPLIYVYLLIFGVSWVPMPW